MCPINSSSKDFLSMSEEVNPHEAVPDVPLESTPEGDGDDGASIPLDKLNELLGRDYKDVDTALESVKETYSFVGKRDELRQNLENVIKATGADEQTVLTKLQSLMSNPEPEQKPEPASFDPDAIKAELTARYEEDRFFDKNPNLESIKDYVKPLKNSNSEFQAMAWDDFAKTEAVSKLVETFSGYEEANSKKSVVESNPKLGAISDKFSQASQALESGNVQAAKATAVSAVIDSMED